MQTESVSMSHSGAENPGHFYISPVEVVAGAVAGFSEHFVMFPFDTIKTRIQSGSSSSIASVFRQMWQSERLVNLYRGVFPTLASAVPAHGAYFSVYEAGKRIFGEESNISIAASATCAIASHDALSTPFDVVKQRMQMDGRKQFASSWRCAQTILENEGMRALFVSVPTTVTMNIPHFATYWIVYEGLLSFLGDGKRRDKESEMTLHYVTAGILAGSSASVASSPLDVVKTQLQLGKERCFYGAFSNIFRYRGVRGFFAGVSARIMYTAPSGAITMATYETTKNYIQDI